MYNKQRFYFFSTNTTLLCLLLFASLSWEQTAAGAGLSDLKDEFKKWQEKIKDIQVKIQKTEEEIERGKAAFRDYQKRDVTYRSALAGQVDSLKKDRVRFEKRSDSLDTRNNILKQTGKNKDLQVEKLRKILVRFCDKLKTFIVSLPPGNIRRQVSSVDFLKGELETRTVTESEAMERIFQLVKIVADASQNVDIYTAPPPTPAFTGQAFYIRVGFAYLAAVQENGDVGAVWLVDNQNPAGAWKAVKAEDQLANLWKAVQVSQKRVVPELVSLPFSHGIVLDGSQ